MRVETLWNVTVKQKSGDGKDMGGGGVCLELIYVSRYASRPAWKVIMGVRRLWWISKRTGEFCMEMLEMRYAARLTVD